jgi:hypothetical protein
MRFRRTIPFAAALLLFGCVNPETERQSAIAHAAARCEAEGKQFVLKDVDQNGIANLTDYETTVTGLCVAPGQPGYVAPTAAAPSAPPSETK